MQANTGEIILYQPESSSDFRIEVRIEDETVWLSQIQMADLFSTTKQNISLHINNIFKENELSEISTVKDSLTVQKEGSRAVKRKLTYYNLDVIISVGYRIKSQRATQFRIWATKILREYLLQGYAINQRLEKIEHKILEHDQQFEFFLKTSLPANEGIFYDGQIYDAWSFVSGLIKSASKSIILIDNYIDDSVLTLFSKRNENVDAIIYTQKTSKQFQLDLAKYNAQYETIDVKIFTKSHDRFLIIDEKELYLIGASLKDLGKKWFAFAKMNADINEIIKRLNNND